MGCMVSALYSTGLSIAQLKNVMNDRVFVSVFSFSNSYISRSFRRREDSRELPNGVSIGLRHRVSFGNSVLTDQGLNAFLDRQFLRYDDQTDFNTLPIPLRCISTDLNEARAVTFARGSIPDAVRASVSLPGVYQPFQMKGHEYIDGGVLLNLPTSTVHDMNADVVLAVSLPLSPVAKGDLNSILGVVGRSFSVAIEGAERQQRKLADVVLMPDLQGFGATDYLKTVELAKRGYAVAEANHETLLKYALSDADWEEYQVHLASLRRGPAGPVLRVRVVAPNESATRAVQQLFAPLVNQPVDTRKIEALLDEVRSDGRYEVDYAVGYETAQQFAAQNRGDVALRAGTAAVPVATSLAQLPASSSIGTQTGTDTLQTRGPGAANPKPGTAPTSNQPGVPRTSVATIAAAQAEHPDANGLAATHPVNAESLADISARPILLVTVTDKKTGPPSLLLGANLQAQTTAFTRATVEGILINQDLGTYGSELRTHIKLGYLTQLSSEYFRPLSPFSSSQRTLFVAPHGGLLRQPFPIYRDQIRVADRQLQAFTGGADLGWTNGRTREIRAGVDFTHVSWQDTIGHDGNPDYTGKSQRAHLLYTFDTQDRALVPQFGLHLRSEASYLYATSASPNAPQLSTAAIFAHRFNVRRPTRPDADENHELLILSMDAGTMFHRNVAEPFRYTLGGPLRLSASAIDQYRGTDYLLIEPMLLRRIAQLPQPLGQSIYLGAAYEFGRMYSPNSVTITRQDVLFGIVAETPLGVITLAPAIGTNGERKFVFTLGKLF